MIRPLLSAAAAAALLLPALDAGALTAQSCAAGNPCICGEWTGAIWAWRKFGPAKCCNPDFVFKGKTRAQWETHLRGPVKRFIEAMEKKFGSQDTAACDESGSSPELAPLLQAAWGGFDGEGLSCVCDPMSRPICKSFIQHIKDPEKGQGKGAACGWKDKGDGAAAPSSVASGGKGGGGGGSEPKSQSAGVPVEKDHVDPPPPLPLARQTADDAVRSVRASAPDCADPKNPNALLDSPKCDQAAAAELAKQIAPKYTAEQAAVYWGWYKTLPARPSRRQQTRPRRQSSR